MNREYFLTKFYLKYFFKKWPKSFLTSNCQTRYSLAMASTNTSALGSRLVRLYEQADPTNTELFWLIAFCLPFFHFCSYKTSSKTLALAVIILIWHNFVARLVFGSLDGSIIVDNFMLLGTYAKYYFFRTIDYFL